MAAHTCRFLLYLIVTFVALPGRAFCVEGALQILLGRSQAVVIGEVTSGSFFGDELNLSLQVDRVLSGEILPGAAVNVHGRSYVNHAGNAVPLPRVRGLWFLGGESNSWELVTIGPVIFLYNYYAVPPGEIAATFKYPKSASLAEQVVLEMASAVTTFGKEDQDEFARAARAFQDFYGIDTPTVRNAYRTLSAAPDAEVKVLGLAGLIQVVPDADLLASVLRDVETLSQTRGFGLVVNAIEGLTTTDSETVRRLGDFVNISSQPRLVYAAACALRAIHTREALPALAKLLDNKDEEIQNLAVGGMAAYAENLPVITADNSVDLSWLTPVGPRRFETSDMGDYLAYGQFRDQSQKQEILSYWRNWWTAAKPQLDLQTPK